MVSAGAACDMLLPMLDSATRTMACKGYQASIEFDDEAALFHGEVTGLRDVVTFQAKSEADLMQAFRESLEDYLAFCAERGEEPERPQAAL